MFKWLPQHSKKLLFMLLCLFAPLAVQAKSISIYYFFPDSPSSNLNQIKSEAEELFADSQLQVTFQPFARLNDFKQQIKKVPPDFIISPAWYESGGKYQKILQAYRKGNAHYEKLLITNSALNLDADSLIGKSLATTVMGYETAWLSHLFDFEEAAFLEESNVVEVVKDIDAIFAVALKQVDIAIVAKSTMQKLEKINPRLIGSIQIAAKSKPLPMPVLMQFIGNEPSLKKMELVKFMDDLIKKNVFEELLLIDDWKVAR